MFSTTVGAALQAMDDTRHRAEFYRMWQVAAAAGFIHPIALEQMGPRGTRAVEAMREYLLDGTKRGISLSGLIRFKPSLFEPFEAALLRVGEASGSLEQSLRLLADYQMARFRMMMFIKKHMAYPLFLSLLTVWLLPLPLVFYGRQNEYLAAVVTGSLAWYLFGGIVVTTASARYFDQPRLVRARLARTLHTALAAGLPLGKAIRHAVDAAAQPALTRWISGRTELELTGQSLALTFAGAPYMTPELAGAFNVADLTGDTEGSLARLAELYEDGFK